MSQRHNQTDLLPPRSDNPQSIENEINEIRRKISALRATMLDAEGSIQDQINRDLDPNSSLFANETQSQVTNA